MEEKCSSPGCIRPAEYTCSCAVPQVLLCETHLSWHITARKKVEHLTRRIESTGENESKECQVCLRRPSKCLCLCRGIGVKLCLECFDMHSLQSQGKHIKEPIEAAEFIKNETDMYSYIERREQIDGILKVVKDNQKEVQVKEEMLRMLNTKVLEKIKKWYEEKLARISNTKKALKQFEDEIRKCKFKKDLKNHWIAGYLKEKDYFKVFHTVHAEINEDSVDQMLRTLFVIEQDSLLSQHSDLSKPESPTFIPDRDTGSLYQRIQSTYSDNSGNMVQKLTFLYEKALEPSRIESIQQIELANCKLGSSGCRYFAVLLPALSQLNYLNLSSNNIGPLGAKELVPALATVKTLTTLLLAWNKLENKGIEYLSECLSELSGLKALQLSWNDISDTGAQFLARSLVQCEKLEKLELWNNPLGPDGIRNLVLTLPYLKKLKTLDLNKTELGCEGAEILSLALPKLPELTNLCIASNNIGAAGIKSLSKAVESNKKLQVIDLARNSIRGDATQPLQETMVKLQKEATIVLNGNVFNKEDRNRLKNCASAYGLNLA